MAGPLKMAACLYLGGTTARPLRMATRLQLCGPTSRLSTLCIKRFAPPLIHPVLASSTGRLHSQKAKTLDPATFADQKFTVIYKFPYIVHATALCRMKIYQTGIAIAMLPISMVMQMWGMATLEQCQITCAVSFFACFVLYIMSSFFRRLVGIMYVNDAKDTLRISHLTFMGKRQETFVPIQDVVPLEETGMSPRSVYYHLRLYSSKSELFYYILRFGGVEHPDLFKLVFGEEALRRTPQKFTES